MSTDLRDLALDLAREASRLAVDLRRQGVEVTATKSSDIDIVTAADQAAQALIRERIRAARPGDGFVGEEGSDAPDGGGGTSAVVWIVDPIDGTVNYLYGLPHFAVSIAVEDHGTVVAGAVVAPVLGLEYAVALGAGATCNGRPIGVRPGAPLDRMLVATGFNYEDDVRAAQASYVARLLPSIRDIRRLGSCALDLCGIAAGTLDAYVEEGAHIWDHAAAGLVLTEAGGILEVTRAPSGKRLLVASAGESFDTFRAAVAACGFIRDEGPAEAE
ncbi:MAG: inositol monophosphatase family protein [Nocardioides sp.]